MGHSGFESSESSQMGLFGCIIFREGTNAASVVFGTSSGDESKGAVTGSFELTVGHV